MKKYILTVVGKINTEKLCKDLALGLTPIVDSPNLKFQHTNNVLLFSFASEVSKEELFDYITGILFGITETFILTEVSDNMTVSLPKDIKEHLMDLEKEGENVDMRIDMKEEKSRTRNFMYDEEGEDDFVALLLEELKENVKKPSLDFILDKISISGFESLSEREKNTLDYYSKNY